jgi:hypothetical protein
MFLRFRSANGGRSEEKGRELWEHRFKRGDHTGEPQVRVLLEDHNKIV